MKRFLATLKLDFKLAARNQLFTISVPVALVLAFGLAYFFSRDQAGSVLAVFFVLVVGASTYFFGAAMVLLEKSQGTLQALRTSPLSPATYFLSKVVTLTILVSIEAAILYFVPFSGTVERAWPLILGLLFLATMQTLIGLGQVAPHDAVTSFLIPGAAFLGTVLQLPVFYVFEAGPPWVWYLIPTHGSLLLILAAFQDLETWQWIYALSVSIAAILGAGWWALRRFERHIGWRAV